MRASATTLAAGRLRCRSPSTSEGMHFARWLPICRDRERVVAAEAAALCDADYALPEYYFLPDVRLVAENRHGAAAALGPPRRAGAFRPASNRRCRRQRRRHCRLPTETETLCDSPSLNRSATAGARRCQCPPLAQVLSTIAEHLRAACSAPGCRVWLDQRGPTGQLGDDTSIPRPRQPDTTPQPALNAAADPGPDSAHQDRLRTHRPGGRAGSICQA